MSTTIGIKHAVGALEAVEAVAAFLFCACAEGRRPLQRRNILLSKTCLRREYDVSHEDKERRKRRNISIRVVAGGEKKDIFEIYSFFTNSPKKSESRSGFGQNLGSSVVEKVRIVA